MGSVALLNGLMAAEFEHHLATGRAAGKGKNHRNGSARKRVLTDDSHVEVTTPRDRQARFDPVLIGNISAAFTTQHARDTLARAYPDTTRPSKPL